MNEDFDFFVELFNTSLPTTNESFIAATIQHDDGQATEHIVSFRCVSLHSGYNPLRFQFHHPCPVQRRFHPHQISLVGGGLLCRSFATIWCLVLGLDFWLHVGTVSFFYTQTVFVCLTRFHLCHQRRNCLSVHGAHGLGYVSNFEQF